MQNANANHTTGPNRSLGVNGTLFSSRFASCSLQRAMCSPMSPDKLCEQEKRSERSAMELSLKPTFLKTFSRLISFCQTIGLDQMNHNSTNQSLILVHVPSCTFGLSAMGNSLGLCCWGWVPPVGTTLSHPQCSEAEACSRQGFGSISWNHFLQFPSCHISIFFFAGPKIVIEETDAPEAGSLSIGVDSKRFYSFIHVCCGSLWCSCSCCRCCCSSCSFRHRRLCSQEEVPLSPQARGATCFRIC